MLIVDDIKGHNHFHLGWADLGMEGEDGRRSWGGGEGLMDCVRVELVECIIWTDEEYLQLDS